MLRIVVVAIAAAVVMRDLSGGTSATTNLVYGASDRAFAAARLMLIAIGGLIAIGRTTNRRDALLFGGLLGLALEVFWAFVPPGPFFWIAAIGSQFAVAFGVTQLIRYAADTQPDARFKRGATPLAIVVGAGVALCGSAVIFLGYGNWVDGQPLDDATFARIAPWLDRFRWTFMLAAAASMEAAAIVSHRSAAPAERSRALLVALGFAPMAAATSLHALVRIVTAHDSAWAVDADSVGYVLTAAILTYGALTRRLIDVEYAAIAAVSGIVVLGAVAVGAFLAEHFGLPVVESILERTPFLQPFGEQVRTFVGLGGGFASFLVIGRFHERMDAAIRGVLFKRRDERVRALEAFARDQLWTIEPTELAGALVAAVVKGANTSSVGVYTRHGVTYRSIAQAGSGLPASLDANDSLVPTLRSPRLTPGGGLSAPMPVAGELYGVLLCGAREATAAYAHDEVSALALVAREAGNALAAARPTPLERSNRKRRPKRHIR